MEQAADRDEAAAIDHYLSHRQLKTFFSSSLPRKTDDFFVMRLRSAVGGAIQTTQLQLQLHQKNTPKYAEENVHTFFLRPMTYTNLLPANHFLFQLDILAYTDG